MKVSAIEIGTNSIKFLIARYHADGMEILDKSTIVNRLSRSMYDSNCISDEAIENGIRIIGDLIQRSNHQAARMVAIFSTSVLRDAHNRQKFIAKVRDLYGIPLEVISGEQEAFFAFKACSVLARDDGTPGRDDSFAVIDIGGGSTEFTAGHRNEIAWKKSIDMGAVRLTEMFIRHDPVSEAEIEAISNFIHEKMSEHSLSLSGLKLIGTGGTVKTLGTMFRHENFENEGAVHGLTVQRDQIEQLYYHLVKLTIGERGGIPGLNPKRADVIVAGALILLTVMREFDLNQIMISASGVLEGFLEDYRIREYHP
jgi:exopolyphosphatase/guanosine-5'-triphosphate,3'-diphosphate pyrophosphatase